MLKIFCGKVFLHWKLQLLVNFIIYCSREARASIVLPEHWMKATCFAKLWKKNAIIGLIIWEKK